MAEEKNNAIREKYVFDKDMFFKETRKFLGIMHQDLCDAMGISIMTWKSCIHNGNLPLMHVISVCNKFCIPISCFFRTESEPTKKLVTIEKSKWNRIYFDNVKFGVAVKKFCRLNMTAEENGISRIGFNSWYKEYGKINSTLNTDKYIEHCNKIGIYPMHALHDFNGDVTLLDGYYYVKMDGEEHLAYLLEQSKTTAINANQKLQQKESEVVKLNNKIKKLENELEKAYARIDFLEKENARAKDARAFWDEMLPNLQSVLEVKAHKETTYEICEDIFSSKAAEETD